MIGLQKKIVVTNDRAYGCGIQHICFALDSRTTSREERKIDSGLYTLISVMHGEGVVHYKAFVPGFFQMARSLVECVFVLFFAGLCIFCEELVSHFELFENGFHVLGTLVLANRFAVTPDGTALNIPGWSQEMGTSSRYRTR